MQLHAEALRQWGGQGGIRDRSTLESAIDAPRNLWHYQGAGYFELAACYAVRISESQAFLDGNKRTGAAACLVFLKEHGFRLPECSLELQTTLVGVAERTHTEADFAALLEAIVERSFGLTPCY